MMKRTPGGEHMPKCAVPRSSGSPPVIVTTHGAVRGIRITRFSHGVSAQMCAGAARDAPVVVLDLRGNPGGLISEAITTVDVFLERGRHRTRGAHAPEGGRGDQRRFRAPLVVVVDRSTASAAEIVAAALGENKRAKIVGTRTFGKASIQAVVPVPGGGAVKLTVATTARPTADMHGRGVRPTWTVKTHLLFRRCPCRASP